MNMCSPAHQVPLYRLQPHLIRDVKMYLQQIQMILIENSWSNTHSPFKDEKAHVTGPRGV